ncbi:flagellar protein FilC, partial [Alcanivorax sp. HI0013]
QHSFGSSLSFDYGIWNNLTFNTRLPVSYKYDTEKDVSQAALGDVSFGLRYQPFPVRPGAVNTTLYTTLTTPTGDSPYDINVNSEVSSGSGFYSLGGGVSMSKVVDPVVLYGSLGYTMAFDITGLNQRRGSDILEEVNPGDSINFSMGMAYALSYEVSLSASYQQSYNFDTEFFFDGGRIARSEDSTSSVVNTSIGLRTSKNRIINFSFGFGLTEDSPDVLLGLSMPIDFSALKPGA